MNRAELDRQLDQIAKLEAANARARAIRLEAQLTRLGIGSERRRWIGDAVLTRLPQKLD